jgi:hypothetical protein
MTMSAADPIMVQPGMEVYDKDSKRVGQVRAVEPGGFRVAGKRNSDVFVPRAAVVEVSEVEHRVDLAVAATELGNLSNPMTT